MPLSRDVNTATMNVTAYTESKQREREQQQYAPNGVPPLPLRRHDSQTRGRLQPRTTEVRSRTPSRHRDASIGQKLREPEHMKIFLEDLEHYKAVRRSDSRKAVKSRTNQDTRSESVSRKAQEVKKRKPISSFDDTQSFTFDDTEHEDEQTQVLRPQVMASYNTSPSIQSGQDQIAFDAQARSLVNPYDIFGGISDKWQEEVAEEKLYQRNQHIMSMQNRKGDTVDELEITDSPDDNTSEQNQESNEQTPSRPQTAPSRGSGLQIDPMPRNVAFVHSPDLYKVQLQHDDRSDPVTQSSFEDKSKTQRLAIHSKSASTTGDQTASTPLNRQHIHAPTLSRFVKPTANRSLSLQMTPKISSRESDVVEASEDDESLGIPPTTSSSNILNPMDNQQQGKKRQRNAELDYQLDVLKKKTYADLQAEDFNTDPQHPPSKPARDAHGNVMTLQQHLTNLSQKNMDEQKAFFRNQSDEEWSQTGEWFVEKFREDLEKLAAVRLERRKISINFEHEIRKRQKEVERAGECVRKELEELKAGGEELTKGRKVSGSRVSTPMR